MRACVLALSVAALVAGCGGDDDETTVTETTTVIQTNAIPPPETEPPETTGDLPTKTVPAPAPEQPPESGDESGAITAPAHCGRIAFAKNTDSGAVGITAVGIDCRTAKAVARAARGRGNDLSYETDGFECRGIRRGEAALASVDWTCLRGSDFVRFGTT